MTKFKVPDDWGKDSLTQFIDAANQNTYSISFHGKEWFSAFQAIDSLFEKFSKNLLNLPNFYEPFLFIRAHSSYRATIRLVTSGQLTEGYSLLRGCLEYALYAFYFSKCPLEIQTWIERDNSIEGKKKARNQPTFGKMLKELEQNNKTIGEATRALYERTIDVGAHPNRKTITLAMLQTENEEMVSYTQAHLNFQPLPLQFSFKTTVQVGICVLKIFRLVFPERFDILGISDEVEKISRQKINGLHL
jgi:hypothetical protein